MSIWGDPVLLGNPAAAVTPEQYGAMGDGVHDDGPALKAALESGKPVALTRDLHLFSAIVITDKDVYLDGHGWTVHLHGEHMERTAGGGVGGQCIRILSTRYEGELSDADVISYTENSTAPVNPGYPDSTAYRRGYLSYHGFNPTPDKETYADYTAWSWYEHHATIQNVRFVGDHVDGMMFLQLLQMCKSTVSDCEFRTLPGHDAAIGLQVNNGYSILIDRVRAENFFCSRTRRALSTGYGIQVIGDAITISNCITRDCKNHINIGGGSGASGIFTTGAILTNCVMQTTDTYARVEDPNAPTAALVQQLLDLHEGCHSPIIDGVQLEYNNGMAEDNFGTLMHFSCPEFTVSNVCAAFHAQGEYGIGYIGFGPLVRKARLRNIHARRCTIFGHGWGFERGNDYDANYIREVDISDSLIGGVRNAEGLLVLRMTNVTCELPVAASHLSASGCVFRNDLIPQRLPTLDISRELRLVGCEVSFTKLLASSRSVPLIKAPENEARLTSCTLRKASIASVFKTEQTHLVNCETLDLWGLVLGSRMANGYVDGDDCELDAYNLW